MKKFAALFFAFQLLFLNVAFSVWAEDDPQDIQIEEDVKEEQEPEPQIEEEKDDLIKPPQEEEIEEPQDIPDELEDPPQEDEEEKENIDEPQDPPEEQEEEKITKIVLNEILADPEGPETEGEFIEIYNAGEITVDLTNWSLDDDNLEDDKSYHFSNPDINYVLEPGSYLTLFRPETKITLNNEGDAVYLFDVEQNEIDIFVFENTSSGHSWGRDLEDSENWILLPSPSPNEANVFENQNPVALIDVQGGTGFMKVNVTGENSFDPDGDQLTYLWTFEPEIFSDSQNPSAYEFSSTGEKIITLKVTDPFGFSAETSLLFVAQKQETEEEGGGGNETPQNENEDIEEEEDYPQLSLINEFLPNPEGPDTGFEWVELYNPTEASLDLSGWYVDDEEGASAAYQIPANTILEAKSYLLLEGENFNLSLKNSSDVVRLLDPNKNESERIEYEEAQEGWSNAKDSEGIFRWTNLLTPGEVNNFPEPPKSYEQGMVIFEAILPNPEGTDTGNEKILLKNMSGEVIELGTWQISTGTQFKTLPEVTLAPGETKSLDPGSFGLTLKNSEGELYLLDPSKKEIDTIKWAASISGQWIFNPLVFEDGMQVKVVEVIDGDTIKIDLEGKVLTVRLLGVDTPETVHPDKPVEYYGKQASEYLKNLLMGKTVRLNFDVDKIDKYGRLLAYVYLDEQFINAEIIKQGYGYAYTRFPFKFLNDFVNYQAEAKVAGKGLWADPEVAKVIEESLDEDAKDEIVEEDEDQEEEKDGEPEIEVDCNSAFLKIDSFMPYPKKDGEDEYIKLINTGEETLCLQGWQLDDVQEGGSKPFTIKEGVIEADQIVNFSKEVTKLSLNNSNDCVTLIQPSGEVADEICYEKTHEGEIFTHAGGNWVESAAKSKTNTKTSSTTSKAAQTETVKHSFTRESSAYRSELVNRSYYGHVIGIDEGEKMLVVELEDEKMVPISYASSLFDMEAVKDLINLSLPVKAEVYETPELRNLISLYAEDFDLNSNLRSKLFYPLLFLILGVGAIVYLKKEYLMRIIKNQLTRV